MKREHTVTIFWDTSDAPDNIGWAYNHIIRTEDGHADHTSYGIEIDGEHEDSVEGSNIALRAWLLSESGHGYLRTVIDWRRTEEGGWRGTWEDEAP